MMRGGSLVQQVAGRQPSATSHEILDDSHSDPANAQLRRLGYPGPGRPGALEMQKRFDRQRDEINDYWNGSACDERDPIWRYWVIGVTAVAITAILAVMAVGTWGV